MMLLPDKDYTSGYSLPKNDFDNNWKFGDFLKKTTEYLKDSDAKIKLHGTIYNIQNTDWPSVESYNAALKKYEKSVMGHVATHKNPFIL